VDRPIVWMGQTLRDLRKLPEDVKDAFGYALSIAQQGGHPRGALPMKGKLREVMEIRVDDAGDSYRAMYTTRLEGVVYVLDAFKKKSKSGIATPQADIDRLIKRLHDAKKLHKEHVVSED